MPPAARNRRHDEGIRELDRLDFQALHVPGCSRIAPPSVEENHYPFVTTAA